jgi:hypothetical protein
MSASKGLSSLLQSLLDSGITIDDGKERIIITPARSPGRKSGKGQALFSLKTMPSARAALSRARPNTMPVTAFTPTGKVSSRKLYSIIEAFQEGISKASLAKRAGVARKKLSQAISKLAAKGLVTERSGRYFPVASGPGYRSSRRRVHDACTVPGCMSAHYAKGLCNNHYNSQRRQAFRTGAPTEAQRRANGSFKDAILSKLREERGRHSLFELANKLNEKWQSLRKDIQELVDENKVVKDGKRYQLNHEY